ncbi:tRNA pseudouridine(55) synthase TruB [Paludibacterium purpuratum]|uniref:tRNA pseudouridine synthase B n=1 Tax=Paludibacterium purpuratum TaxID=1144873 RepID=A0A4R7BAT5_9NEIS|nr:tRNA pseudouridine(55) synthase TruB [Paludibacterium purpuratum]TDR82034.1 tRNA pseudouridine synthase B [Paludibacterium purpuratum]
MTQVRRVKRPVDGVLLLDKPYDISSNGALQKARWLFQAAKGGHTGVLDPLATGLLPICFGEATKFSSYLLDADKAYRATVCFGRTTTTGDIEGEVVRERPVVFNREALLAAMQTLLGEIEQVPPMYSALKHQGRALYEYAREGVEIERAARRVTIHSLTLLSFDGNEAVIDVVCSKGTYVRTLAEDLGEKLAAGAHLTGLRRTATAGFRLDDAVTLESLEALDLPGRDALLLPPDVLVQHLPAISLDERQTQHFCHGQAVRIDEKCETMSRFRVYQWQTRKFLGLAEALDGAMLQPVRLMAS